MHYSQWEKERKKARKRDKDRCQKCGLKNKLVKVEPYRGAKIFYRSWLHLHHLDPEKEGKIKAVRVTSDELILLCPSCHRKTWHINRKLSGKV
jgi:predicted HNH restriction endonuclease